MLDWIHANIDTIAVVATVMAATGWAGTFLTMHIAIRQRRHDLRQFELEARWDGEARDAITRELRIEEIRHDHARMQLRQIRAQLAIERQRVDHFIGITHPNPRMAARNAAPFTDFGAEPAGVRIVDAARRAVEEQRNGTG